MSNRTNIYEFTDTKGIVVAGDIHGDFKTLVYNYTSLFGAKGKFLTY